jgi:threonine/homoserine efflux transporter RhtA
VTPPPPFKPHPTAWPIGVLSVAMVSVQCGAALVKALFPMVGVAAIAAIMIASGGSAAGSGSAQPTSATAR